MGRKLDALIHRRSKLKTAINLAISRLAILKNNRHARFSIVRSDIVQLLFLNHHQQALIRAEQLIKDQNMLVVYDMIHDYCHLLKQRVNSIEQATDCPKELKEAVSSLLYAAPRCGEFPELQKIREILTAHFRKELGGSTSTELRSNNGVSQKMIQKLSSKDFSLECRTVILKEIAKENGLVLQLEDKVLPEKAEKVLPESPGLKNVLSSEQVKSKSRMIESSSTYESESDYDEIIEEDEGERSKLNMEMEELDDLYRDDDDNIKTFKKMDFDESKFKIETETTTRRFKQSRTSYFSSYRQFPLKSQQADTMAGDGTVCN